ncbi:hypothetical protein ACHAW5_005373 [Stephanodiscus triporus]|uniref:Uncharacterized protein n=1 Tax=Stephanodiscus triporus TaxID=2934178 RepID=A0ABD3Q771_9STRA
MPDIAMNSMSIMQEHAMKCNAGTSSFLDIQHGETVVCILCYKYQVDTYGHSEIEKKFLALGTLVQLEVPLMPEKGGSYGLLQQIGGIAGLTGKSHMWLRNMDFIGGDQAIHHTIRLLQIFGSVISSTPLDRSMEPKLVNRLGKLVRRRPPNV